MSIVILSAEAILFCSKPIFPNPAPQHRNRQLLIFRHQAAALKPSPGLRIKRLFVLCSGQGRQYLFCRIRSSLHRVPKIVCPLLQNPLFHNRKIVHVRMFAFVAVQVLNQYRAV